jgi:hypothetical protein
MVASRPPILGRGAGARVGCRVGVVSKGGKVVSSHPGLIARTKLSRATPSWLRDKSCCPRATMVGRGTRAVSSHCCRIGAVLEPLRVGCGAGPRSKQGGNNNGRLGERLGSLMGNGPTRTRIKGGWFQGVWQPADRSISGGVNARASFDPQTREVEVEVGRPL